MRQALGSKVNLGNVLIALGRDLGSNRLNFGVVAEHSPKG